MHLISKLNKGICFLLRIVDIFSKYAWVIPSKNEKDITISNAVQKILDEFNRKTRKIWVDKGSEFYNRSMKQFLQNNDIDRYLKNSIETHSEGKSVIAERFIRTLENKIYKHMTPVLRNVYIDKLDDIGNKYNNIYHGAIKMKRVDVKSSIYIDFNKENNKESSKFKVSDNVRTSKYNNIFAKGYVPNWF